MAYKVLYRKYRPDNFDSVVGQDYTISMLKNAIINQKNAHAYIFTGPRGTGKTSSAKIFAKALNCENPINGSPCNECTCCKEFSTSPDIIEIDAASNNGVDEIRELINNVKLVPSSLKYKVYIIDEVHMLTTSAFNALLLTLEEPPSHIVFILATTDIQDVPITILSRCQRFDFKPIDKLSIINRLKYISDVENIDIEEEALAEIALVSAGGMRDALGMLDQLSSMGNKISLDIVSSNFGSVSSKKIKEILSSIENNDSKLLLSYLECIKESGTNYSVFVEKLILELRKCAIDIKLGKTDINFYFEDIFQMILDLNECLCNININVDPYILIEMVLLKYINSEKLATNIKKEKNIVLINNIDKKTNNFPGNIQENVENNQLKIMNVSSEKTMGNNLGNNFKNLNLKVRVNNCFVNASKEYKLNISNSWVDFMNYLMSKDRSLISLLVDTSILAASDKYVLIQSKIDSTNDLINEKLLLLEDYYKEYSGLLLKFAAIKENLWKKEVEKYRLNRNNKIKYNYIDEENITESDREISVSAKNSDIEEVAKDIFGSFEIE